MLIHYNEWLPASLCTIDSTDNSFGGGADYGSFGGSIEANGSGAGIGGGNGVSGASGQGIGTDNGGGNGLSSAGGATVDLSGSGPGVDYGTFGIGLAGTIASLGNIAMGNPFAAITLLTSAGMAYGPAVAATKAAISFAYAQDEAIANAQMSAFTQ